MRPGMGARMAPSVAAPALACERLRLVERERLAALEHDRLGADLARTRSADSLVVLSRQTIRRSVPVCTSTCSFGVGIHAKSVAGTPGVRRVRGTRRAARAQPPRTPPRVFRGGGTSCSRCFSMKPVSMRPATNSGCDAARARKAALVLTGHTSTSAHAAGELRGGRASRWGVHDQLGDHRIVERRDGTALLDPGVDANARGQTKVRQRPCRRQKAGRRIFRIQPRFHRVTLDRQLVLRLGQRSRRWRRAAAIPRDRRR